MCAAGGTEVGEGNHHIVRRMLTRHVPLVLDRYLDLKRQLPSDSREAENSVKRPMLPSPSRTVSAVSNCVRASKDTHLWWGRSV